MDAIWLTEHHFTRHGLTADATGILHHIAARTERVRLGTAVSVLPFHNPLRLAESIATLDVLSRGRVNFGVCRWRRVPRALMRRWICSCGPGRRRSHSRIRDGTGSSSPWTSIRVPTRLRIRPFGWPRGVRPVCGAAWRMLGHLAPARAATGAYRRVAGRLPCRAGGTGPGGRPLTDLRDAGAVRGRRRCIRLGSGGSGVSRVPRARHAADGSAGRPCAQPQPLRYGLHARDGVVRRRRALREYAGPSRGDGCGVGDPVRAPRRAQPPADHGVAGAIPGRRHAALPSPCAGGAHE